LLLDFIMKSPRSYGPFSSSQASHSSLNSFISHGEIAPYCSPPGKEMTLRLSKFSGPIPLSKPDRSFSAGTAATNSKRI
jgi:hypothetical protein